MNTLKSSGLKGLKATLPRMKILELFNTTDQRHLSAEDIYRKLSKEPGDVSLATVYRVLLQFEQAGILKRSNFEGDRSVFELNEGDHHDHLVCLTCGRVEEFYDEEIERRQLKIAHERGFDLQDHRLALYGQCARINCAHRA